MFRTISVLVLLTVLLGVAQGAASSATSTHIEIILDCSDTMKREVDGERKIDAAKSAVIEFINGAPETYEFALRVMGGNESATYYASNLVAQLNQFTKFNLIDQIKALEPGGQRSLYSALLECTYDFPDYKGNNIVLVITDGLDDGNQSLSGLADTYEYTPGAPRLYILGLDITKPMETEFNDLIKSSGGQLLKVAKPSELKSTLQTTLGELGGNMTVFLYNEHGVPVKGDIVISDVAGNPVFAGYEVVSITKDLTPGLYNITATYHGEVKTLGPVDLSLGGGRMVKFIFTERPGNVRINLVDSLLGAIKGYIKVRDLSYENVYSGGPASTFLIPLPDGTYEVEATAGGRTYIQGGVVVREDEIADIQIVVPVTQAALEVEVNNLQSRPVNAHIQVYTLDGFLMGEAQYASYYQLSLPPDIYNIVVEAGSKRVEETVSIYEGDQQTANIDIDLGVGYLIIELRTDSGKDVWGMVRVYDERGEYQRHWAVESDESPDWSLELPEGTYRVEAEAEGIVNARDGVIVKADTETRITINFPDYVG